MQFSASQYSVNESEGILNACVELIGVASIELSLTVTAVEQTAIGKARKLIMIMVCMVAQFKYFCGSCLLYCIPYGQ